MAKPSTSKIELTNVRENEMIVVTMGYQDFVMSPKDAFALSEILSRVERYESKYYGSGNENTFHVYPSDKPFPMNIISDDVYRMAKLAGKPVAKD
jgi:hypothetical protein